MAVITPQTDVYLLKVPLEINDINQLTFTNATNQYNYFNSLPKLSVDNFTYQRKDGTIRFGGNFDDLISFNYVMYRNDAYSNKWFYAYITGMEYLNDNVTAISIKTDVWQTWQFVLNYKPCLIDREHSNSDVAGEHTLPENLELGEMVLNGNTTNFGGAIDYCIVVEVSMVENVGESQTLYYHWVDGQTHDLTPTINGLSRGTIPLIVGYYEGEQNTPDFVVKQYDRAGLGDAIQNVYMLPKSLIGTCNRLQLIVDEGGGATYSIFVGVPNDSFNTTSMATQSFTKPISLAGNFTPKNKKLLSYPFCYFNISNNAGTSIPYHYEDFSSVSFKVEGTFGVSGNTKAIPQNYKNLGTNNNALDYSISGAKYPVGSWVNDSYTNWLTQNAVNLETRWRKTIIGGLLGTAQGGYSGYVGGKEVFGALKSTAMGATVGAVGLAGSLINEAREQHQLKTEANFIPDQAHGNLNAGDLVWSKYKSPFTYLPMSIKPEYARCIDEFFSQFGYKCNRVKTPNITGRRNWNYVKTVGCYIAGDIPQDDMSEIKAMFDRGVTFWHNPATFMDYSQNNDII